MITPVNAGAFTETQWANGNGRATELAVDAAHAPWRWRISLAQLDSDTRFSAMPGVRRQFAPLDAAIDLQFASATSVRRVNRFETLHFDGGDAPNCHIPETPTRAINLMLRGDTHGVLLARPLANSMVLLPQPAMCWFVYMLAGQAELLTETGQLTLTPGFAAWVALQPGFRARIDGGGEVALVQLHAAQTCSENTAGD